MFPKKHHLQRTKIILSELSMSTIQTEDSYNLPSWLFRQMCTCGKDISTFSERAASSNAELKVLLMALDKLKMRLPAFHSFNGYSLQLKVYN